MLVGKVRKKGLKVRTLNISKDVNEKDKRHLEQRVKTLKEEKKPVNKVINGTKEIFKI